MERLTCPKENGLFRVLASFQGVTEIKDEKEKLSSDGSGQRVPLVAHE